jgi:hypothetical protein
MFSLLGYMEALKYSIKLQTSNPNVILRRRFFKNLLSLGVVFLKSKILYSVNI